MKALQVSRLVKSYGGDPVLRGVTLSLEAGERVALMGPSGSGKSTLLNCAGGIERPDSGSVSVGGRSLEGMDEAALCALRRSEVGSVFQFFHLLSTLTAAENVEFPMQLEGTPRRERAARVAELIGEVGLERRADALPHELSGGEMQRVAIARALANRPRLLLADEPTGNLDSATGESILELLAAVGDRHGVAMLLVTHSPAVARICRRVLEIRDGVVGPREPGRPGGAGEP